MDKNVDEYIEKQKSPQKEICAKLRKLILKTFPNIKEEIKMGVPWYEERFYIGALMDHVNLGFLINGLSEKEIALFEGTGKTMRHIKIFSPDEIDEKRIAKLLELVRKKAVPCSC